ncbi:hypothetical protein H8A99_32330 [Bradyrhizobium sp. Arg68]|nr:hypothetical protein [Bradyrhizobium ivorense]MCC8940999.1 hypothetical protein [Bradyrhizobium ivorense]
MLAKAAKPAKKPRKAASGQKEVLMSIEGEKPERSGRENPAAPHESARH